MDIYFNINIIEQDFPDKDDATPDRTWTITAYLIGFLFGVGFWSVIGYLTFLYFY